MAAVLQPQGQAFEVEQIGVTIGARIHGIDLARPLDDATFQRLEAALGGDTHIVGVSAEESRALLAFLCDLPRTPEYQFRVRWKPGTIVFWDNRSTQHYACNDYYPNRRRMERVAVAGDRPF
jgi:alpha-ketoglutarate-dependent taurine dioxygenase